MTMWWSHDNISIHYQFLCCSIRNNYICYFLVLCIILRVIPLFRYLCGINLQTAIIVSPKHHQSTTHLQYQYPTILLIFEWLPFDLYLCSESVWWLKSKISSRQTRWCSWWSLDFCRFFQSMPFDFCSLLTIKLLWYL